MTDFKVVWLERVLTHHSSKGAVALLKMRGEGRGGEGGGEGKAKPLSQQQRHWERT